MEGVFCMRVRERERGREMKRELLGFLEEKNEETLDPHYKAKKFSSYPNHVAACGPKVKKSSL